MKILVTGDTHQDLTKLKKVWKKLDNIDLIIHCGDLGSDSKEIEETFGVKTIGVRGNCDEDETYPLVTFVETKAGKIMVTHGHAFGVNTSLDRLLYSAMENQASCVCFGHTHLPLCEDFDGIQVLNPGSLTKPLDNTEGSYGIILIDEELLFTNLVYYSTIVGEKDRREAGGYLRDMLNYSDRF